MPPSALGAKLDVLFFPPKLFSPRFGDNIFSCKITKFESNEETELCFVCQYINFVIELHRGKQTWVVRRRFREFDKLYQHCFAAYSKIDESIVFPVLPPKTYTNVSTNTPFLEQRMQLLSEAVEDLLVILSRLKVLDDPVIKTFFHLDEGKQPSK